jgi:hypothetical protein
MDKKNVQKSICQNLFAQKRAALGKLRNFFGTKNALPLWCDNYSFICIVNFSLISCATFPKMGDA